MKNINTVNKTIIVLILVAVFVWSFIRTERLLREYLGMYFTIKSVEICSEDRSFGVVGFGNVLECNL